jgi:hypothetical protein
VLVSTERSCGVLVSVELQSEHAWDEALGEEVSRGAISYCEVDLSFGCGNGEFVQQRACGLVVAGRGRHGGSYSSGRLIVPNTL